MEGKRARPGLRRNGCDEMSNANQTIEFERVALRRGETTVFRQLDLVLADRRIGVLGDNGAGKSSFLRLFNGLLLPDSGAVRVHGLNVRENRRDLPRHVGFVFQNPDHQIVFPTVLEEMSFGLREHGLRPADAEAKAREVLARYGCAAWVDAAVHELSDGQKQRLCILAVVATAPDVLVLDEPFSSLDLPTRLDLMDMLLGLPQTLVVASHELEVLTHMERCLWLGEGGVVMDGAPRDVIGAYRDRVTARRAAGAGAAC